MREVTINAEERLFVIPCGDGFSCQGFDYTYRNLCQIIGKLAEKGVQLRLDVEHTLESAIGTLGQYKAYCDAISLMRKSGLTFGTWFSPDTPKKVQRILEDCRKSGNCIRVFYGDSESGRDWMGENDMIGCVGRSTGIMRIPLLVAKGEYGGGSLLDSAVVRIIDVDSGKELYVHPKYHQPEIELVPSDIEGYTHAVKVGGKLHARFHSIGKASSYIAFLSGDSMNQPQE